MSKKSIIRARALAAKKQHFCCYYCGLEMWVTDLDAFVAKFGVSKRQAEQVKCTAEHVIPRCEGGTNENQNIVAACWHCNRTRHARRQPISSSDYKRLVQRRMSRGRWLLATLPMSRTSQTHARK